MGGGGSRCFGVGLFYFLAGGAVYGSISQPDDVCTFIYVGAFFVFAAHLFCTFCILCRIMLLQHAGGSHALHFYTAFFN